MALYKEIINEQGISVNYWIISKTEKDKISESAFLVLYGYTSKEQKDNGYKYMEKRYLNIYPKDYDKVFNIDLISQDGMNETKSLYEFIKQYVEDFKDATDI